MANYYYDLKVIMCRERSDSQAVGSITHSEPDRTEWNFTYTAADVADEAAGETAFLSAFDTALANAPQHIKRIKKSGTGSLNEALDVSATQANDGTATSGPWSERVGKDVFRYEIGVSGASAADAITNRTAHNLS